MSAPANRRRELLVEHVGRQLERVLQLDGLDIDKGLFDLGLDSLTAVELKSALERSLGMSLSPTLVFDYPTVAAISAHLHEELDAAASRDVDGAGDAARSGGHEAPSDADLAASEGLDQLSADELLLLLGNELAHDS